MWAVNQKQDEKAKNVSKMLHNDARLLLNIVPPLWTIQRNTDSILDARARWLVIHASAYIPKDAGSPIAAAFSCDVRQPCKHPTHCPRHTSLAFYTHISTLVPIARV
jgi:hypothetical protein